MTQYEFWSLVVGTVALVLALANIAFTWWTHRSDRPRLKADSSFRQRLDGDTLEPIVIVSISNKGKRPIDIRQLVLSELNGDQNCCFPFGVNEHPLRLEAMQTREKELGRHQLQLAASVGIQVGDAWVLDSNDEKYRPPLIAEHIAKLQAETNGDG